MVKRGQSWGRGRGLGMDEMKQKGAHLGLCAWAGAEDGSWG